MKMSLPAVPVRTLWWEKESLYLLDQRLLPRQEKVVKLTTARHVHQAIRSLQVRGAPAIGVAAGYGVVLEARRYRKAGLCRQREAVRKAIRLLRQARPTAYNLFFALQRMEKVLSRSAVNSEELYSHLLAEATAIYEEDMKACWEIGEHGYSLISSGFNVLTHCNAGGLATSGYGTALAVFYSAWRKGIKFHVYVDETRPVLQGARLTAYELKKAGIPCTLICDNVASFLMAQGKVNLVVVGADRIARNGDTANKIGTYGLAVSCKYHHIPFYVAAPLSTFHLHLSDGKAIPVEERNAEEVTCFAGRLVAPENISVYNPAFDITPGRLITGFITEKGILQPPYTVSLRLLWKG